MRRSPADTPGPLKPSTVVGVAAGTILLNAATFAVYLIVARLCSRAVYGDILALLSAVYIGYAPAVVIAGVLARRIAIAVASGAHAAAFAVERRALKLAASIAVLAPVAGVAAAHPLARIFQIADAHAVAFAAVLFGVSIVFQVQRGALQGLERYNALGMSFAVEGGCRIAFGWAGAAINAEVGFFSGTCIAAVVVCAYNAVALRRSAEPVAEPHSTSLSIRGDGRTAIAMFAITILGLYDALIAKRWLSPDAAGIYAVASIAGRATYSLLSIIPAIVLPRVIHSGARADEVTFLRRAFAAAALPVACVLYVLAVAPRAVVTLIGGIQYLPAAEFLLPLAVAGAALTFTSLAVNYLLGRHRFAVVGWLALAASAEVAWVATHHSSVAAIAYAVCGGHVVCLTVCAVTMFLGRDQNTASVEAPPL